MKDLFKQNFDKLLLLLVFLVLLGVTLHVSHGADASTVSWAREEVGTVLGGLLGLITGAALRHQDPPKQ